LNFSFEAPQGGVERFAVIDAYFSQALHLPTVDGFQQYRRERGRKLPSSKLLRIVHKMFAGSHQRGKGHGAAGDARPTRGGFVERGGGSWIKF
jgi:hypothetical protein